ncbi:peptidase inhibitor family I36 protein [Streptomyces poriticola]|uniref:peptidase inhibitor family I36 protein n=1 Tax=Streptomyces poriticola TaxID=3120506 RepID=UPI002FCE39CD
MIRRIAIVAATTLVGVPLLAGVSSAAKNDQLCTSGEFCLFENYEYNEPDHRYDGHTRQWTTGDRDYGDNDWFNSNDNLDNEASSVKNKNPCTVVLYQHPNFSGAASAFKPGAWDPYLKNNNIGDNRASSHRRFC